MMFTRDSVIGLVLALGFAAIPLSVADVFAQQVEIRRAPPVREREVGIIPPGLETETRPRDMDIYPPGPRVRHDPAFIEPFSKKIETPTGTGRMGLSGWTAPNTPVGAAQTNHREVTGWFALGFSVTWDGPPPTTKRPAR